jgi:hypothetical protein
MTVVAVDARQVSFSPHVFPITQTEKPAPSQQLTDANLVSRINAAHDAADASARTTIGRHLNRLQDRLTKKLAPPSKTVRERLMSANPPLEIRSFLALHSGSRHLVAIVSESLSNLGRRS